MTFEEARAQFPVLERCAYLNAGSNGPLPRAAADAARARLERDLAEGRSGLAWVEEIRAMRERIRVGIATVLGTSADFVALTDSTTRGCQIVVTGLGLSADDEIVTTDQEHFGLIGPLHASGARVVVAEADEEALLAAVTPRTRLIAVSHVLWTTGRRLDLARLRQPDGRRFSSTAPSLRARSRSTSPTPTTTRSAHRNGFARSTSPVRSSSAIPIA